MRFVIERVNNAKVTVDGNVTGSIGKGLLIFFGADMKVQLENDGPFTICLDSDDFGF